MKTNTAMLLAAACISLGAMFAQADPMARIGEREFPMLDTNDGYDWLYDQALFWSWRDGDIAYLCGDFYDYDPSTGQWGALGTGRTLKVGDGNTIIWDYDGHYLLYRMGGCYNVDSGHLTLRNGAIYQLSSGTTADFNWIGAGSTLVFVDSFQFVNSLGDEHVAIDTLIQGGGTAISNNTIIVDGAKIQTTYLYNFDSIGDGNSIVIRGSSDIYVGNWYWWGNPSEAFRVWFLGGWFNLNPTSCGRATFGENCTILDFGDDFGDLPQRYRLFDNIEGWTFDSRRDFGLVFPSVSITAPASPIPVAVNGDIPEGNTLLADLTAVDVQGDLAFSSATEGVKVALRNGLLYASPASSGGMFIFMR